MPMPPRSSMLPEREARNRRRIVQSDACHQKPQHKRDKALSGASEVMNTRRSGQAAPARKILERAELINANSASAGAASINTAVRTAHPMQKRPNCPKRSLSLALFAIAYASSYTHGADAGVPACGIRQPGISPEKIAIAVAEQMAAIAGIGAMKKRHRYQQCRGHIAVSPGNRANKEPEERRHDHDQKLYGSNTSAKACAQALLIAIFFHPDNATHHANTL